ncbi:hypothetical protein ACIXFI_21825 [Bacteroides fragilis]
MKKVRFLLLAAFVTMLASCQKEVVEQDLGDNKPTPTGDTRIIIEGEGMIGPVTRSSDGRVDFEGGYATGAGLYDGDARPIVAAYPDAGYEVNYFYGGPENELHRYDYAQSGTSTFDVKLRGEDHTFRCGFKEKKRNLTVNSGTGGAVSPSGTNSYRVEKPISITATPNSGYEFAGWTVTEGDITIENPGSPATTATLHNSNSTITANFKQNVQFIAVGKEGYILTPDGVKQVGTNNWNSIAYGNGRYIAVGGGLNSLGYITTSTDGVNWSAPKQVSEPNLNCIAYGNGKFIAISAPYLSGSSWITYVFTFTDGESWTRRELQSSYDWKSITYANGKFVAVGTYRQSDAYSMVSTDGITWTVSNRVGVITDVQRVAGGNALFVGTSENAVITSADGLNWNRIALTKNRDVAFGNNMFVCVGNNNFSSNFTDVSTWNSSNAIGKIWPANGGWSNISFSNGVYVTIGMDESSNYVTTSNDAVNWTEPQQLVDNGGNAVNMTITDIYAMP